MVTSINKSIYDKPMNLIGLNDDKKPIKEFEGIEIPNGSTLYCMDTQKAYMYDEENSIWIEQ